MHACPRARTLTHMHNSSSGRFKLAIVWGWGGGDGSKIFELALRFKEDMSSYTVFEVIELQRAGTMIILAVGFHAGLGVM